MTYEKLLIITQGIIEQSDIHNFTKRIWIYKKQRVVIDLIYKGIKFAIDIKINSNNSYSIYLVNRSEYISFMFNKSYKNYTRLCHQVIPLNLKGDIINTINNVFMHIDRQYKFDVSVVVPVHNREHLILKCLDSLKKQSLSKKKFEVIFVDDKSTDDSVSVIKKELGNDVNYKILKREVGSGNASAPRNDGIKSAMGRYVFFLDSDDYISHNCLEDALLYADRNDSDILYLKIGTDNEFKRAVPTRAFKKGTTARATVINNNLLRCNAVFKFYRRSFLLKYNCLFDPSAPIIEDRLFSVMTLSKTKNISILADDEYVFITKHDSAHLSGHALDLTFEPYIHLTGYTWIFISDLDFQHKFELFNAWTMVVIDRLIRIMKRKRYSTKEKEAFFCNIIENMKNKDYFFDRKIISKEYHNYLNAIEAGNFNAFLELVLE